MSIEKLLALYRNGEIPEALLFTNLMVLIPKESIENILSALTPDQRREFLMEISAVSKPDWISLDGWRPRPDTLAAIREYLGTGPSSAAWKKHAE